VRLVAQSMGGWTCLEYALRRPESVRALVMASTSGAIDYRQLAGAGAAEIGKWHEAMPKLHADLAARDIGLASGARMTEEQPALAMLYRQILQLTPADFRSAVLSRILQMRVQPPQLLARLSMPVLFLTGSEDCLFPAAAGSGLATLAPRGRAVDVPKAGHSVYFERAAEFNRIVEEFLS
jgi:3-oxoadipate enol-lactonase